MAENAGRICFRAAPVFAIICPVELMRHETMPPEATIPERPGQHANLGWAALCGLGGLAYGISGNANAPRSSWFLGGILLAIAAILLVLNRLMFARFERLGWWQQVEAASLALPAERRFAGGGWQLEIGEDWIHTVNHGRYGPVENTLIYDAISRVDVLGEGTDLILTNEFANPYLSIRWEFMPKAARVALLRWLRLRAPQARFSPLAEKIEDGWFPRAIG